MSLEIAPPRIPEPSERYDRANEAAFRSVLSRALRDIIAAGGTGSGTGTGLGYDTGTDARPPTTPTAKDDEFNDATTVDGGSPQWTKVNWADLDDYDVDSTVPGALWLYFDNSQNHNKMKALLQAVPSGDFTIQTRTAIGALRLTSIYAGLILTDGTTDGAGNQVLYALRRHSGGQGVLAQAWSNFNTFGSTVYTEADWGEAPEAVLRIRRNGTDYYFDASYDGLVWTRGPLRTISFAPTHFGVFFLAVAGSTTNQPMEARFDYFRYGANDYQNFASLA